MAYHHHKQRKDVSFDPYLTATKEDYQEKQRHIDCDPLFLNRERNLDRLWAYTSATGGPERRSATTYSHHHGSIPSASFHKNRHRDPVQVGVQPSTTLYETKAALEAASQKVFRPTTEYRDEYFGARPGMQPPYYMEQVRFSQNFSNGSNVPKENRSSQHRTHDHQVHNNNPNLNNPDGTRYANTKNKPLTTGIVPTTVSKAQTQAFPTHNRVENTTYGDVYTRPFSGVCKHATPQNFSAPQMLHHSEQHRIPPPPVYPEYPANNNYASTTVNKYSDLVSVPMTDFSAYDAMDAAGFIPSEQFADGADQLSGRAPSAAPSNRLGNFRSPSPAPPSRLGSKSSARRRSGDYGAVGDGSIQGWNPYRAIPAVNFTKMPPPRPDDPTFDMGDVPPTPNMFNKPPSNQGSKGQGRRNDDSKLNMANIESIIRDAEALSSNIRKDITVSRN